VKPILIDSNGYTAFKRGDAAAIEIVRRAERMRLSAIVLGELLAGFRFGKREAVNRRELSEFLASPRVDVLAVDEGTAEHYRAVYGMLRSKGKPIPTNDLWIAASALQHGCALFSFDAHFHHVDGLTFGAELGAFLP
jgi:predicted nucleic acid-binding protein